MYNKNKQKVSDWQQRTFVRPPASRLPAGKGRVPSLKGPPDLYHAFGMNRSFIPTLISFGRDEFDSVNQRFPVSFTSQYKIYQKWIPTSRRYKSLQ